MKITQDRIQKITQGAIALAIKRNRVKVIALLRTHGVNIDTTATDEQLITAVLVAMRNKLPFRNDLHKLLMDTTIKATNNFTGESGFFFTGGEGTKFFNVNMPSEENDIAGTSAATTAKEKTAAGLFLQQNLGSILSKGLDTISTVITNKSTGKLADKAIELQQLKLQTAAIEKAGGAVDAAKAPGLSTGAKIAIGVLITAIVGTAIYFIAKKSVKKKKIVNPE